MTILKNKILTWPEYLHLRENAAAKAKSCDMYYIMLLQQSSKDANIGITTMYAPIFQDCLSTAAVFIDAMNKMNASYIVVVDNEVIGYSKPANIITEWRY